MKMCSLCHEEKPRVGFYQDSRAKDGLYSACKVCHLTKMRSYNAEWYKKWNTVQRKKHMPKLKAHWAVNNAIKSGKLVRQSCEECGQEKAHAHHDDYSKPLCVVWLCRPHHMARHKNVITKN